ncbi:hypothetical protein BDZ97DRAFT_1752337 [Flammula alnicola]|nr:hypothetical protein BDZ97DRAFT_1752337 [Flammula alnicola]
MLQSAVVTGKWVRKPSKALLHSQGLPSGSEDSSKSDSSSSESESDGQVEILSSPAPSAASSAVPSTAPSVSGSVVQSLSTASISMTTEAQRRAKFEARYKCSTTSPEKVLELQMKSWKSDVYKHFKMPPAIVEDNKGNVQYSYTCLSRYSHPSSSVTRARHDESIRLSASASLRQVLISKLVGKLMSSILTSASYSRLRVPASPSPDFWSSEYS